MSRDTILTRVRSALAKPEAVVEVPNNSADYFRETGSSRKAVLCLFAERLVEYGAGVYRCTEAQLSTQIASILLAREARQVAVPSGVPPAWLDARITWVRDEGLSYAELDSVGRVLTGASAAVAESGSLVLQHGPREGRRALTLLPDYHLCVIFEDQIHATLPSCFAQLADTALRPTTFISGPSATADIEMTRIQGVHGPRFLDVLIAVSDAEESPAAK